jgi:hypothetical protein
VEYIKLINVLEVNEKNYTKKSGGRPPNLDAKDNYS